MNENQEYITSLLSMCMSVHNICLTTKHNMYIQILIRFMKPRIIFFKTKL
jgi:hypothetical protein